MPRENLATGRRLGKYEIVRRLARGGMAEIYLARLRGVEGFDRLVVLKRVLPHLADDRSFVDRFLDEARIAATLYHIHIVQMLDVVVEDGDPFLVMEFLDGCDLATLVRTLARAGRRLPLEDALYIVSAVCAGLHYAHEKTGPGGRPLAIVHRDISPENVFLTVDGGVKILDFGIAKSTQRLSSTQSNSLKGKLGYMSPEQCRGDVLDRRSDVFSLSVVLWELTVGRRLFRGDAEYEIMRRIVEQDAPSPVSILPDYPSALADIVRRGLARDPAARYGSAQSLQSDLEGFARAAGIAGSSLSLSRRLAEVVPAAAQEDPAEGEVALSGPTTRRKSLARTESLGGRPRANRRFSAMHGAGILLAIGLLAAAGIVIARRQKAASQPAPAAAAAVSREKPVVEDRPSAEAPAKAAAELQAEPKAELKAEPPASKPKVARVRRDGGKRRTTRTAKPSRPPKGEDLDAARLP
jgi:serine/threonine protein kinase